MARRFDAASETIGRTTSLPAWDACTPIANRVVVDATDSWIDTNVAAFNTALPEPGKSALNATQKTIIFCYVALKRAGIEV